MSFNLLQSFFIFGNCTIHMRIQILETGSDQVEYSKSVLVTKKKKKKKVLALDVNFRVEEWELVRSLEDMGVT